MIIDFTSCRRILHKAYNGANGKKIAVVYEGAVYMLKFPPSAEDKPTTLSYTNSCFSEHIGSRIFRLLGIDAQETLLGTYVVRGKTKIVCACRDFTIEKEGSGKIFYDFCSIKNTVIDSAHEGRGTELVDLEEAFSLQQFVAPDAVARFFWRMFVVDALLGNFDRHNGNWGFLMDPSDNWRASIAPVFDCGSCLLPQADETTMKLVLADEEALNARIFQFPTSAIHEHGRKISYYDFLMAGEHDDCNAALAEIVPRVELSAIYELIAQEPLLSDLQKAFYKPYLTARFERLLLPAYKKHCCAND